MADNMNLENGGVSMSDARRMNDVAESNVSAPEPTPEQIAREQKIASAIGLFERTMQNISSSGEGWISHLDTAAAFHKYSFADQLMIGAQRPNATAVAELQTWNKSFGRKIKKGSKGIALLVPIRSGDEETYRLRYVFDVSDTERTPWIKNAAYPRLWKFSGERHGEAVLSGLQKEYGIKGATLDEQIAATIAEKIEAYKAEYDFSALGHDDTEFIQKSAEYIITKRLGIEPKFEASDFDGVAQIDVDSGYLSFVGDIVNETSLEMLRVIERDVKARENELRREERLKNNERSIDDGSVRDTNEAGRRDRDTGSGSAGGDVHREVRSDEGAYLEEHRHPIYTMLLTTGRLSRHLAETNEAAETRLAELMDQLQKTSPAPDRNRDPMAWVSHMETLQAQAEEIILSEIVYAR